MKILGVCCSGRVHGNTERLLEEALNSAKELGAEIELVRLAKKHLLPCDGCAVCFGKDEGGCHIKDDLQGEIFPKMVEADGLIFGSPVYMGNVTAQAKMLMDRSIALKSKGKSSLRGKIGGVVITTGRIGSTSALSQFHFFFGHRITNAGAAMGFTGDRNIEKIDKSRAPKESIMDDRVALGEARGLGKAIVRRIQEQELLKKCIASSKS